LASPLRQVVLRATKQDRELVAVAARSIARHVPNALEIVLICPEEDLPLCRALALPANVTLVGETDLFSDLEIQTAYTTLMSDQYCKGDYVMHLE
jgi:hypothetical protein